MYHSFKNQLFEKFIELFFKSCALLGVLITFGILIILISESSLFFKQVSLKQFLIDTQWTPLFSQKHFGISPLLTATLLTATIAMLVALPLGLLSAIYLTEFASRKTRRFVKPLLELLAGVPTVVYGYFALIFITPALQQIIPNLAGFNALSPGLIMGIMIIPMICSLSEDAFFAVPAHLREAAYGLGARKIGMIFRVLLPAASKGIKTSIILAISRAIGETMIVTLAAGQRPRFTLDPRVPVETMTAYIVQVSLGDTPHGSIAYQSIFVVGTTLFFLTFALNLILLKQRKNYDS